MFIFTVKTRLKSKKRLAVLLCAICATLVLIALCAVSMISKPADTAVCDSVGEYSLVAQSQDDIAVFISQFSLGYDELYSEQQVYIPSTFDDIYNKYNELQKRQGLNLEKYKGVNCTLYIYKLKDHLIDGAQSYISIIVYKDRVIGGHISTGVQDSPMYTFFGE